MLTDTILERILSRLPSLTVGVVGDLFLDRYLDIDAALTEPSLETGLDAYQVTQVRSQPGAAGTVINNLVALGVRTVLPLAIIGDDGEGYELRQALSRMRAVNQDRLLSFPDRRTPTYTKPMLLEAGKPARELNRLDIKNRTPTPESADAEIQSRLRSLWEEVDALIVLDQVSEAECGVVTSGVRERLAEFGARNPKKLILADSRERIHLFRNVTAKVNERECRATLAAWGIVTELRSPGLSPVTLRTVSEMVRDFAQQTARPVYCTHGELGMSLAQPDADHWRVDAVPGYPVQGEIDTVGAGDSVSAAIASAVAAGATPQEAAAFGNLVASITVQQIGTTGTASPEQVRRRWAEVRS